MSESGLAGSILFGMGVDELEHWLAQLGAAYVSVACDGTALRFSAWRVDQAGGGERLGEIWHATVAVANLSGVVITGDGRGFGADGGAAGNGVGPAQDSGLEQ